MARYSRIIRIVDARRWRHLLFLLWLMALTGCGTVAFKPGSSSQDMTTDEQQCRAANPDKAAVAECMRQRGWSVLESAQPAPAGSPAKELPAPVPENAGGKAPAAPVPPAAAAAPVAATTPTPSALLQATPPPTVEPPADADPLTRLEVAAWWKLGAGGGDLDRAIDACVTRLGAAHRPDANATVVTAGLYRCLREAGWYAVSPGALR